MKVVGLLGIILCLFSGTHGQRCSSFIPDRALMPCARNDRASEGLCGRSEVNGKRCCFKQNRGCVVDSRGFNLGRRDLLTYSNSVNVPTPPSSGVLQGIVQRIPTGNSPQAQQALGRRVNRGFRQNALQRTLTLGLLLGSGGIADIFPRCPVHVKLCYRVPCGGYRDSRVLDNNPGECLKDPTCCYDYELAFLKSIFGPNAMGGAPSCYYGPTSQQWRYITSFFKPWNPWFTNFIVEAFKEVFNTKLFNIGGQVLCQFNFQVKNYPVGAKSELECNLVSGCWDSSRPVGKQCTMASSLIKNSFGGFISDEAIYPSLFTDDFDDTRCASNWFNFGPRAYRRMECDVKDEPDELVKKITDWCPWQDCCLNYAAFNPTQLAQVSFIGSLGGGGTPIGGGILPISGGLPSLGFGGSIFGNQLNPGGGLSTPANANLLYLLTASSSSLSLDLEKLFCPYRNLFSSFIDLTETTEGCCDIPKCYHKKQFVGRPTTPTPPPVFPPPFTGNWGQWGQCNAACGQRGSRMRTCFVNGRSASSAECAGAGTDACSGSPCQQFSYSWGTWTASPTCSVTCGDGTLTYTRPCLNNFQQTVSSSLCPGGASGATTTTTTTCNRNPCPTDICPKPEQEYNGCSTNCPTTCDNMNNPPVFCNTGCRNVRCVCREGYVEKSSTDSTCVRKSGCLQMSYSWGTWTTSSGCSATCDGGTLTYTRPCLNNFQQAVSTSLCPGGASGATTTNTCNAAQCPTPTATASYSWGQWSSACSVTCGGGTLTYTRQCLNSFGQPVASYLCPGGASGGTSTTLTRCNTFPCPGLVETYSWGEWTISGDCSVTCGSGSAPYTRQCQNNFGQAVSIRFCRGAARRTFSCSAGPCRASYQWSGRYVVSTRCSGRRRCGMGTQVLVQNCIDTQTAQVVASYLCGSNQPNWRRSCFIRFCPIFG